MSAAYEPSAPSTGRPEPRPELRLFADDPPPWRARVSACRPMETIILERTLPEGVAAITAVVDRRTGELAFVGEARRLSPSEAEELRGLARGEIGRAHV